jgi:hypothetical protein
MSMNLCGLNGDFVSSFRDSFLGAFAKLRKTASSFVVSVRPSVRMEQLGSHWTDFHEKWHLSIFENLSRIFKCH